MRHYPCTLIWYKYSALGCALLGLLLFGSIVVSQTRKQTSPSIVVSAQVEKGTIVYRLDGKRVEDSVKNSLLKNLGEIVKASGTEIPVSIIIDVRAPFSEVGKLETALDKVGLTHYRLFVSNFNDRTMNEIHWDEKAIPIPSK